MLAVQIAIQVLFVEKFSRFMQTYHPGQASVHMVGLLLELGLK